MKSEAGNGNGPYRVEQFNRDRIAGEDAKLYSARHFNGHLLLALSDSQRLAACFSAAAHHCIH